MVDDIRIAALSAKMGVPSISDDLQIAFVKTDDGWSGEPRRRRSGMLPVTARCWVYDLSCQRLGLFSMPPAATVEADVLKNCGSCYEVNTGLSTKAALAFLAAFKVLGVFLSHKDQRIELLNMVCLSVSAYILVRLHDSLGFPLGVRRQEESSSWV
jgi:hypothetical protein